MRKVYEGEAFCFRRINSKWVDHTYMSPIFNDITIIERLGLKLAPVSVAYLSPLTLQDRIL